MFLHSEIDSGNSAMILLFLIAKLVRLLNLPRSAGKQTKLSHVSIVIVSSLRNSVIELGNFKISGHQVIENFVRLCIIVIELHIILR